MTIEVGTRVAFKRAFLKSIFANTGWMPAARGEVMEVESDWLVKVKWGNHCATRVNPRNLVREDRIHLEPV